MKSEKLNMPFGNYSRGGAVALVLGILSMFSATVHSQVIAGWDAWDNNTAPSATVTATDVTAFATASGSDGNWNGVEQGDSGRGASVDTTWGSFLGPPIASAAVSPFANFALTNGKPDGELTFTITNNGVEDINLDKFHFDAIAFRPNAARTYALNVLAGSDITVGNVFTSETDAITHLAGNLSADRNQHDEIDLDLTGLADSTLAAGETAIIQLAFSDGEGSGGGHHLFLDNVAVSAVPNTDRVLVITDVPTVDTPAGTNFPVTVEVQDGNENAVPVSQDTQVVLSSSGAGTLSGNTGTIIEGTSSVILDSVQSTLAPETITLNAVPGSGDVLNPSDPSAPFNIVVGAAAQLTVETAADGFGELVGDQFLILGTNITGFAVSRDAGGNFVESVPAAWTLEDVTGGLVEGDLMPSVDGTSATLTGTMLGSAKIRATADGLESVDSGVLTVIELISRWDGGGGNGNLGTAGNWLADTAPIFGNMADLIFHDPTNSRLNPYIGEDRTIRSLTYDADADQNLNFGLTMNGTTGAASVTFDTHSDTDPAEIVVDADATGNFRLGRVTAPDVNEYGSIILADDLLVTHNGTGTLTIDGDITESVEAPNITKSGTGTVIMTGSNSYTGNTTVTGGVLSINGTSLSDTGALSITDAVVEVEGEETVGNLLLDGVRQSAGVYGSSLSAAPIENQDDTRFAGTGVVTVVGISTGPLKFSSISFDGSEVTLTWTSSPGETFSVFSSFDLKSFGREVDDSIEAAADAGFTEYSFPIQAVGGDLQRAFFIVRRE